MQRDINIVLLIRCVRFEPAIHNKAASIMLTKNLLEDEIQIFSVGVGKPYLPCLAVLNQLTERESVSEFRIQKFTHSRTFTSAQTFFFVVKKATTLLDFKRVC